MASDNDWEEVTSENKNIKIHWVRHAESCSNISVDELEGGSKMIGKVASVVVRQPLL